MVARACLILMLAALVGAPRAAAIPRLKAAQLAIVINDADPDSVGVCEYYRRARNIPQTNVVHVHIPGRPRRIDPPAFARLQASINRQLPPGVEALLLV